MANRKIMEFQFAHNTVAITYAGGETIMAVYSRLPDGTVLVGGRRIGIAQTESDVRLLVREFFVDAA